MKDSNLTKQWNEILDVLNIDPDLDLIGGVIRTDVNIEQMKDIVEKAPDYINLKGKHNYSPSLNQFIEFCETNPQFVMEAVLVEPERDDYRVDVDGVKAPVNTENTTILYDWINSFDDSIDDPSEYGTYNGNIRAWWD